MLREAYTWLATRCAPATRRLGYLQAAIGLESRAARCRTAWLPHLENCRAAIRQSMQSASGHRHAIVFGSGLTLEYPLDELAARFRNVTLVDIVHLPVARRAARRFPNVELVELDLTGCVEFLHRQGETAPSDAIFAAIAANAPTASRFPDADWVVSCNLLSQLPLLPIAWLQRRRPDCDDAMLERWGRTLMARHLEFLGGFDAQRCLIADATQTLRSAQGIVVEHANYATPLDMERHAYAAWDWAVAPAGELADGMTAVHRVMACNWPRVSSVAKMLDNAARLA